MRGFLLPLLGQRVAAEISHAMRPHPRAGEPRGTRFFPAFDEKAPHVVAELLANTDGPFDQLADNYAEEVRIAEYMVRENPSLAGKIDRYGYFEDANHSLRVSLTRYYAYNGWNDLLRFAEGIDSSPSPYRYIAEGKIR